MIRLYKTYEDGKWHASEDCACRTTKTEPHLVEKRFSPEKMDEADLCHICFPTHLQEAARNYHNNN